MKSSMYHTDRHDWRNLVLIPVLHILFFALNSEQVSRGKYDLAPNPCNLTICKCIYL